jgi:hypothetical protein
MNVEIKKNEVGGNMGETVFIRQLMATNDLSIVLSKNFNFHAK